MTTRRNDTPLNDPAVFETGGIKANGDQPFALTFMGFELYDIVQTLEQQATNAKSYREMRACVLAAETIRERADRAGWGRKE